MSAAVTLLAFRLGERRLAVAASQVVRVAEVETLHRLPGDLEASLGLVVHDAVAVGVLDLEILLDLRRSRRPPPAAPFFCVFARFARGVAGFPVDELLGLRRAVQPGAEDEGLELVDLGELEALR